MFEKFKSDLSIVFDRDPAARSYLEIITTYPGVHAILFHRVAHRVIVTVTAMRNALDLSATMVLES